MRIDRPVGCVGLPPETSTTMSNSCNSRLESLFLVVYRVGTFPTSPLTRLGKSVPRMIETASEFSASGLLVPQSPPILSDKNAPKGRLDHPSGFPSPWSIREQRPDVGGEVGQATLHLGACRAEVDEPVLEDRPRHRFQRLVHPAVQVDLVVKGTENGGDSVLLIKAWDIKI